ncbi:hypothetical protein jhhlp_002279, partial [Lomentospora prolificans]
FAMATLLSVSDHIRQLNDARKLVLGDVKLYPSVVKGILPIIAPTSHLELRRWTADFLADTFATPALPSRDKESMQPFVLDTVQSILENPEEDAHVLRSMIQTAASIYPITLRWIMENSYDTITWERITAVKTRILQIWDNADPSVQICCIKFAQKVVLSQSVSGMEPRRGDGLDVSLDKIPPNHALLDPRMLEAEAFGLLDRMLGVLQDNSSDALVVDATLNCLSILVRTRPATSNRIVNTVLNFNPLKLANSPMTPKDRVLAKSMEKTTRMFLIHLAKRDPHNPLTPRIHQQIERLMRMKTEIFDETARKRALDLQQKEMSDAKRLRTLPAGASVSPPEQEIPRLGPPPHTLGAIFTLTSSVPLASFDVGSVPLPLVARLNVSTLVNVDRHALDRAIQTVRDRLTTLAAAPPTLNPNTAPLGVEEDDDDYEPDFYAAEDTEQILNKLDSSPTDLKPPSFDDALQLEAFTLASAPPLTTDGAAAIGKLSISQLVEQLNAAEDPAAKRPKIGFNRFASSFGDRDSLVTLLVRLAAQSTAGLDDVAPKKEDEDASPSASISGEIRGVLHTYIVDDFRKRIDVAVAWLCEEWLNDKLQASRSPDSPIHYEKLALKLLDGILPYLHPQDKILTRFLAEIPQLSPAILSRIKHMCRDPTVVGLALTSLLYLIMMKPPVRELALDTVEGIWEEYEDARPTAGKYLAKYRPAWLENAKRKAEMSLTPPTATANGGVTA